MSADHFIVLTFTVIITIGFSMLSVEGILCHQCNSHLDSDCEILTTSTSPANSKLLSNSNQYLKECNGNYDNKEPFCRKTIYTIEYTEEHRVIRSCGWINERSVTNNNNQCINADNEGYKELICSCYTDACNSSISFIYNFSGMTSKLISIFIIFLLLRNIKYW